MIKFLIYLFFFLFFVSLSNGKMLTTVSQSTLMQMDSTRVISLLEESVNLGGVDFRKAIKLAEEAKEIAIALDHPNLIISSELSLFQRFFYLGLNGQALESVLNAMRISEETGDLMGLAKSYYNLGSLRLVMEDYVQAKDHTFKAKEYFIKHFGEEQRMDLSYRAYIHNNLGVIYSGLDEIELSEKEFSTGIYILENASDLHGLKIQLYNNL